MSAFSLSTWDSNGDGNSNGDGVARAGAATQAATPVALLRLDVGLRAAVPAEDRLAAERAVVGGRHEVPLGPWRPEALALVGRRPFAAVVLEGVIIQEVVLAGRANAQLLGPDDVLCPWANIDTALPCTTRWTCAEPAVIAVLDDRFIAAARRWPGLFGVIHGRLNDQLATAATRAAITGLPRVEQRVLALFWQLADRWGVVRPEGVVIRLTLTHELIGRLIAAKRPTVSLALTALGVQGALTRDETGAWTLARESLELLGRDLDSQAA